MPSAPDPITSTPDVPGQPWDATSNETVAKWKSVDGGSGHTDMQMRVTEEFPSADGWSQT